MLHVGEKLREERTRKGHTLEEISKATKIRLSFLQAIEKGEYKSFAFQHLCIWIRKKLRQIFEAPREGNFGPI